MVLSVAYLRGIIYVIKVFGRKKKKEIYLEGVSEKRTLLVSICDVVLFRRLFRVNKPLWLGEWLFHLSFTVVLLSHLRLILSVLPRWWYHVVCMGKYAGWVMTLSMVYILLVRASIDYRRYITPGNLFLILLILFSGLSGLSMRYIFRVDIISVKAYMLGLFAFEPASFPAYRMLLFHYLLALLVLIYLPSHIITAPLTIKEARRRQRQLTGRMP